MLDGEPDLFDQEPITFLVVEDDRALRETLAQMLAHEGYSVETAANISDATDIFEEGRYACALVDLGLPDGSGIDLLQDLRRTDPATVFVVLTGQSSSEIIIDTMRAGAFDFLQKPVDLNSLKHAVSRALSHHAVIVERENLLKLLTRERDQLRARVDEATAGLRNQNDRLSSLLQLSRISANRLTARDLLEQVFSEIDQHLPLRCMALCDVGRQKLLAVFKQGDEQPSFVRSEGDSVHIGFDSLLAEADPEALVKHWVERNTGTDTSGLQIQTFSHSSWSRSISTVGFFLDPSAEADPGDIEFLDTCAHFLTYEWDQGNLLLQNAHHASLGNIAIELARNFIQPLTAIRTASDIISENAVSPGVHEGIKVTLDNIERLTSQTQEFRKLAQFREDSIETVRIDEYVEQALDMLAVAIQNRNVTIQKEFEEECECVLLNGTALARTILDLLLHALRAVEVGGTIVVRLRAAEGGHLALEICHEAVGREFAAKASSYALAEDHPTLQLANRTVHTCGGQLSVDVSGTGAGTIRILLSRNATDPASRLEPVR